MRRPSAIVEGIPSLTRISTHLVERPSARASCFFDISGIGAAEVDHDEVAFRLNDPVPS
jgi:hypothetical protein